MAQDPVTEQLHMLADLSQQFAYSLDITQTLDAAVERIADYMDAQAASVFLVDPDTRALVCRACFGPVDVRGLRLQQGQGIVGRTASTNSCQIVKDAKLDEAFAANVDAETGFVTRSTICTPLRTSQGVIGVIQVLNKQQNQLFSERDQDALRLIAAPTALAINNARLLTNVLEQERLQRELRLARQLQESLLPPNRDAHFPIAGANLSAREVSGDFFDYFELPDGRIAFTVGDVSGKGVDAALLMVRATSLLRWAGKLALSPGEWLARVNNELCESVSRGMFVCTVAGYLNPTTGRVVWANAGLPPPITLPAVDRDLLASAPPLGVISASTALAEFALDLRHRALIFYTDGVSEARNDAGEQLDMAGLSRMLDNLPQDTAHARLQALLGRLQARTLQDDATLLWLQTAAGVEAEITSLGTFSGTASPTNLAAMRAEVRRALATAGCDKARAEQISLAINEAFTNVYRHAYRGDDQGKVELAIEQADNRLVFTLRDFAPRIDCDAIRPRDLSECRPGGLGINLIDTVMDHWRFAVPSDGPGNELIMEKHL